MTRVTGKVVNGVVCLVFILDGTHFAVSIDGKYLVATW